LWNIEKAVSQRICWHRLKAGGEKIYIKTLVILNKHRWRRYRRRGLLLPLELLKLSRHDPFKPATLRPMPDGCYH
jgi:hypothetical protein